MPPRRSQRQKRPSAEALEAIVAAPQRQARRVAQDSAEQGPSGSGAVVPPVVPPGSGSDGALGNVSPAFLDQLVARVTAEVTKQLQPLMATAGSQHSIPTRVTQENGTSNSGSGPVEVPVVEDAVRAVGSTLAGEGGMLSGAAKPNEVFTSVNLPVDARVPAKIKTKIWQEEFIDFGSLLVQPHLDEKFQITIHNSKEGSSPSLALEPLNKAKRITSIDTWIQAFHVFVGVYTGRYPQEAPGLMKYGATIQDLAARGHNWRFYDDNFRFLRQSQATALPWGNIHWELWLRSQNSPTRSPPLNGKSVSPGQVPRGYCYKFHRGGDCSGCSFKHSCWKCEGLHRGLQCNFRTFSGNGVNSSQFRRPRKPPSSQSLPQPSPAKIAANTRKP